MIEGEMNAKAIASILAVFARPAAVTRKSGYL